jgi:sulfotransferase
VNNGIHFISGLPRSGSTLLASILRQNPRLHAEMMSPLGTIFQTMQGALSRKTEGALFIDETQKQRLLAGLFTNFYHAIHPAKVVIDTNRLWCSKLPVVARLFPAAKVICCVRDISWIIDSIERLVRRNPFELSGLFGFDTGGTVFTRANRLAAGDGMVGFALDGLKEAFYGEESDRLLLVEYEALTRAPRDTISQVYAFLGEPPFAHDFDNLAYDAKDFDAMLGTPGLHHVARKIAWTERPSVLPPELFARFANDAFWKAPAAGRSKAKVLNYGASAASR